MKFNTLLFAVASLLLPVSFAQEDPGPSPTASVGCEPHGDHWDCAGPRESPTAVEQEDAGPSPTASVGCEPHGDHWDCDGPRESVTPAPATQAGDPGPSPTASVGCEPHGDHWDCDAPSPSVTAPAEAHADHSQEAIESQHPSGVSGEEGQHASGHAEAASSTPPEPTESVGCELHGDHYDCDGPATAASAAPSVTGTGAAVPGNGTGISGGSPSEVVPFEGAASAFRTSFALTLTALIAAMGFMVFV